MIPAIQSDVWKPATETEKIQALVTLAGLPSRQTTAGEMNNAAFMMALDGVTRYGLSEAIKAILKGALGHAFLPSPPELRQQCDKAMEVHERERERIVRRERMERERLEHAPRVEPTPHQRARVSEAYKRFCTAHDAEKSAHADDGRADVRARYGMSPESLASIADAGSDWRKLGK